MTGAIALNFHEGSRSEILADYLFSNWGTVTPVRRQDDHGVDLFCTLVERRGQRGVVTDYYTAQVKSETTPWVFDTEDSVRWLLDYPTPLLFACVDKKKLEISVYHTMPRFLADFDKAPSRLELLPGTSKEGESVRWEGDSYSLSAPIIRITVADLLNEVRLTALRDVLAFWVRLDQANSDLRRMGLLRFRMPPVYRTNEVPTSGTGEQSRTRPNPTQLDRGILSLFEVADCVGNQLLATGDHDTGLTAAVLLRQLYQSRSNLFDEDGRWRSGSSPLTVAAVGSLGGSGTYYFERLDQLIRKSTEPEGTTPSNVGTTTPTSGL